MNLTALFNAMPGAIAQGLIWGIMAIGVYITYKVLDLADLTVDGSMATGGAVCVMLMLNGVNVWIALLCAIVAGMAGGPADRRISHRHGDTAHPGRYPDPIIPVFHQPCDHGIQSQPGHQRDQVQPDREPAERAAA
jgi:hypothetical protein